VFTLIAVSLLTAATAACIAWILIGPVVAFPMAMRRGLAEWSWNPGVWLHGSAILARSNDNDANAKRVARIELRLAQVWLSTGMLGSFMAIIATLFL